MGDDATVGWPEFLGVRFGRGVGVVVVAEILGYMILLQCGRASCNFLPKVACIGRHRQWGGGGIRFKLVLFQLFFGLLHIKCRMG